MRWIFNFCQLRSYPVSGQNIAAFSLVEVTIAMGLVAFCLVAMLGVLPVGLRQARQSAEQLTATQVLATVESDFQNVASGSNQTSNFAIPITVGAQGAFFVDAALALTPAVDDAEYRILYQIANGGQQPLQMHVFIARARPGQAPGPMDELAKQNAVAEGIVQQRLN